jgi:hypothetical protein
MILIGKPKSGFFQEMPVKDIYQTLWLLIAAVVGAYVLPKFLNKVTGNFKPMGVEAITYK